MSQCSNPASAKHVALSLSEATRSAGLKNVVSSPNTVQLNHFPECRTAAFRRLAYHCRALDGANWTVLCLARIIHEKCAVKAKPLISFTTMRMGCLMKFFAMKSLAQVFGGLGRFRAVR